MTRDQKGKWMAGAAIVFAIIVQIGVFVMAGGPEQSAPVAEAMNTPAK